ncbi:hypothetical protein COCNU_07G003980 [Cocos nucifera]|uniref:CAAX prenyl protease 2/Lysostaphin resistance protein A-like domain-containing protein n=1 Tax=Cocos nucifera TaxID=13894 RepID=A0A8K0IE15_COCNU|nr:hypothetical protein COCNU_07G003980 [Cocos nucifera]
MELRCVSPRALSLLSSSSAASSSPSPSSCSCSSSPSAGLGFWPRKGIGRTRIKASAEGNGGEHSRRGFAAGGPAMEVSTSASPSSSFTTTTTTAIDRSFGGGDTEFVAWEKLGAVVRLSFGIGIYGAMALAGKFICSITGVDCTGGFHPSLKAIVEGLGYAAPPIMALLFILDDEVVKHSPQARAIRDVEDEELWSFFYGMSPWQFILIVTASSVGEELFYRAAVQGALADMFLKSTELMKDAHGIASLTGMLPLFVPFAQAFAAVITAALTGSLYYVATAPKDPTYVVAPVLQSRSGHEDLKKLFSAWYEKRQMKKIYSPLLEGLLALYLGFEWIQTDNILAPMITHGIYSAVVLGHGLCKIHDHRRKLRQRIRQVRVEAENLNKS